MFWCSPLSESALFIFSKICQSGRRNFQHSGDQWLENPECDKYHGGVDKDGIRNCILDKEPEA
jgi:hypothetical protein